jgi:hypothetical protein
MNDQPELFPTAGAGFRPDFSRTEPLVWARELLVLREFKPGEEHVVRRINLRPGLNILWARPRVSGERPRLGEAGVFGHASGKTTFCRLLRHILGEDHFGNDDLRSRIRDKFYGGWVVGEVMLDGKPWLVCRPIAVGPHPFVVRDAPVSKLFDEGLNREPLQVYLDELNRLVMEPLPVATFATSPDPIEWPHLVQWLSRDQECRFAGLTDFRHPSSSSDSPEMDVEDRHFLFRAMVGLINTAEQEELERNKTLVAQKQSAEKRAPLLRHQAKVAYDRLRAQLPEQHTDLMGELFLEAVRKSSENEELGVTRRINALGETPELKAARKLLATAQANKQAAENRAKEIAEAVEGVEKELQVLRGELPQKALDDYWKSKNSSEKMCLEPLARAIAVGCPLAMDKKLPEEPGKAAVKIERNTETLGKVLDVRRKELKLVEEVVAKHAKETSDAETALVAEQKKLNDVRDALIEQRSQWRTLSRQARQAKDDDAEAANLEKSLGTLEKQIRQSQERQTELREQQNRALTDFTETFNRVAKAVLGTEVNARVQFRGRQLDPKVNHRGDLTSAAIETVKILAFDLAALISSIEGRGQHPRFLLHDGPREADMASDLYQKLFLLARELEISFGPNRTPNFQYIVTTTEPPPEDLQSPPWRLEPILDASTKQGRLLKEDL